MTIADIQAILKAELVCGGERLDTEVHNVCGSDMMSDVPVSYTHLTLPTTLGV